MTNAKNGTNDTGTIIDTETSIEAAPPERLSDDDLRRLTHANLAYQDALRSHAETRRHAKRMVALATETMQKARGVAEYIGAEVQSRYAIGEGDALNDDGSIIRAGRA